MKIYITNSGCGYKEFVALVKTKLGFMCIGYTEYSPFGWELGEIDEDFSPEHDVDYTWDIQDYEDNSIPYSLPLSVVKIIGGYYD